MTNLPEETDMSQSHGVAGADPDGVPPEINTNVAHPARVYDYWLGGKDNFPADRALAEHIMQAIPTMRAMAAANRAFLTRAVRYLAEEAGVRQFLDIGTGIPTSPNVHEVAQAVVPDARVVYVDNDPIVLAHARALLKSQQVGGTAFILADLRDPQAILDHPTLQASLDLTQPVALLMVAVLMYFRDTEEPNPFGMVATLLERLPSGSYLAVSHPTADFAPEAMAGAVAAAEQAGVTLVPRSEAETEAFFAGLKLVKPGVVPVLAWRPDAEPSSDPHSAYYWAGVGRKP
jgi:O-methyltransferase involved in polyketide biosynthesis